jgi:hypothetical protein
MYDIDREYDCWLQEQANLLKNRSFEKLDIENLIEELEALVRGEKSAVESLTINIMAHLLYCQYWEAEKRNIRHWQSEIFNFRIQLQSKLTTNLKNYLSDRLEYLYSKAKKLAELKSGVQMPDIGYSLAEILDEEFLPSQPKS